MSVLTSIDEEALIGFLGGYDIGDLVGCKSNAEGKANSNIDVETASGHYLLTLLEQITLPDLSYVLALLEQLGRRGIPCPRTVTDRNGADHGRLAGRIAVLAARPEGTPVVQTGEAQCAAVGTMLAALHLAGADFSGRRPNPRGPHWWRNTAASLEPSLDYRAQRVLQAELDYLSRFDFARLPHGAIHADLSRDKLLFDQDRVSGLLDLFSACDDLYVFDLAVTINAWCSEPDGGLDRYRMRALVAAYDAARPLEEIEHGALPPMLRAAALRDWLSGLMDAVSPRAADRAEVADADEFLRILLARRAKLSGIQGR